MEDADGIYSGGTLGFGKPTNKLGHFKGIIETYKYYDSTSKVRGGAKSVSQVKRCGVVRVDQVRGGAINIDAVGKMVPVASIRSEEVVPTASIRWEVAQLASTGSKKVGLIVLGVDCIKRP